jgi:KDO2-lipid IV(A) lauroyltransferase
VAAELGEPICALYLPLASPVRDRLARRIRAGWTPHMTLIPASPRAMRQIIREVSRGRHLVLFVDEEKDGHVWTPSFGRQLPDTGNRWFAARLAVQHGMAIVPVFVERLGLARYRVVIEPPLLPRTELPVPQRLRSLAEALDGRVEAWLQPRLDHWLWLPYFEPDRPLPSPGSREGSGGASTTSQVPSGR